jgi:hypothetical protein
MEEVVDYAARDAWISELVNASKDERLKSSGIHYGNISLSEKRQKSAKKVIDAIKASTAQQKLRKKKIREDRDYIGSPSMSWNQVGAEAVAEVEAQAEAEDARAHAEVAAEKAAEQACCKQ